MEVPRERVRIDKHHFGACIPDVDQGIVNLSTPSYPEFVEEIVFIDGLSKIGSHRSVLLILLFILHVPFDRDSTWALWGLLLDLSLVGCKRGSGLGLIKLR